MKPLRLIAVHEAGHAVVAMALGSRVTSAEATDDVKQYIRGQVLQRTPANYSLRKLIRVDLAGNVAECLLRGVPWSVEGMERDGGRVDLELAYGRAQSLKLPARLRCTPDQILQYATIRTSLLLHRYWSAVERIAAALIERQRLNGAQLQRLYAGQPLREQEVYP